MKILVFARAPIPGRCKTRLIPRLGARGAAALHRQLVLRTLHTTRATGLPVELWCAPDTSHGFFAHCRREFGIKLRRQCHGNLGRRMAHALSRSLGKAKKALLVGTDCPGLEPQDLVSAFDALEPCDVVLYPASDGGFVLIGAQRMEVRALNNIRWSSGRELAQTCSRVRRRGLSLQITGSVWQDLDTPEDYRRVCRQGLRW